MRMSFADVKSFPRFANYVRLSMPQLVSVPVIVHNMKKFGSLSEAEFRLALSPGTDPLIVIVSTLPPGGPGGCSADGLFVPTAPNEIQILQSRVDDFERSPMTVGADSNARGEEVIIVGVVLLHELVHWGNFRHGVPEATEQGEAFVVATYGKRIPFFSSVPPMTVTPF